MATFDCNVLMGYSASRVPEADFKADLLGKSALYISRQVPVGRYL